MKLKVPVYAMGVVDHYKQYMKVWHDELSVVENAPQPKIYLKQSIAELPEAVGNLFFDYTEREVSMFSASERELQKWHEIEFTSEMPLRYLKKQLREASGLSDDKSEQIMNHLSQGKMLSAGVDTKYVDYVLATHPDYFRDYPTQDVTVFSFDLEQWSEGKSFEETKKNPLMSVAITVMKNGERSKHYFAAETPEPGYTPDDKQMLLDFVRLFKEIDPDVVTFFNGCGYDIPVLLSRCRKHGIATTFFDRNGQREPYIKTGVKIGANKMDVAYVDGRVIYDVKHAVDADQTLNGEVKDRKLKTVAAYYQRKGVIPADVEIIMEEMSDNRELCGTDRLQRYNESDVTITDYLFDMYVQNNIAVAEFIGCPLDNVVPMATSYPFTIICARLYNELGIVPNGRNIDRNFKYFDFGGKPYQGAKVDCYQTGRFAPAFEADVGCLHKDTLILTDKGYTPIKNIRVGDMALSPNGYHVISDKIFAGRKNAVKITLENGREIICSDEHRFPVVTNRRNNRHEKDIIEDIRVHELSPGDLLISNSEYALPQDKQMSEDNMVELAELLGAFDAEGHIRREHKDRIRHDRGGYIQKNIRYSYLSFTTHIKETDFQNRIMYLMEKHFPGSHACTNRKSDTNGFTIAYADHSTIDAFYELISRRDEFLSHVHYCAAWLRGFFTGDATYNKARSSISVSQCESNGDNIQFASKCLDRLGIVHYVNKPVNTGDLRAQPVLSLEIYKKYTDEFMEKVGFIEKGSYVKESYDSRITIAQGIRTHTKVPYFAKKIRSIEYLGEMDEFWDITMQDQSYPYFYANGILSHNSLYPSVISSLGLGPENTRVVRTIPFKEQHAEFKVVKIGDKRFYYIPDEIRKWTWVIEVIGYSPVAAKVAEFLKTRFELKNLSDLLSEYIVAVANNKNTDELEQKLRDIGRPELINDLQACSSVQYESYVRAYGLKVVLNSVYGLMGSKYNLYGELAVATLITGVGRQLLQRGVDFVGLENAIATDTDSVKSKIQIDLVEMNLDTDDFVVNVLLGKPVIKWGKEKFKAIYMKAMKTYLVLDGRDKLKIHGVGFKSSAMPLMADRIINELGVQMLERGHEATRGLANRYVNLSAVEAKDYILAKRMQKPVEEYADGHMFKKVAINYKSQLGIDLKAGGTYQVVKTKRGYEPPTEEAYARLDVKYYQKVADKTVKSLGYDDVRNRTLAEFFN